MPRLNRKKKPNPERIKLIAKQNRCSHPRWTFIPSSEGVKRTCTSCGYTVREVAQGVFTAQESSDNRGNIARRRIDV